MNSNRTKKKKKKNQCFKKYSFFRRFPVGISAQMMPSMIFLCSLVVFLSIFVQNSFATNSCTTSSTCTNSTAGKFDWKFQIIQFKSVLNFIPIQNRTKSKLKKKIHRQLLIGCPSCTCYTVSGMNWLGWFDWFLSIDFCR